MTTAKNSGKASKKIKTLSTRPVSPDESKGVRGGSQTGGLGAGRVTLNPFSITRKA